MDIRLSDKRCLTPRLLERDGRATRRVQGVLESRSPDGDTTTCRFVEAVRYDGLLCRYRVPRDTPSRAAGISPNGTGGRASRASARSGGDGRTATANVSGEEASRWVDEDDSSAYRPFSHLVLERLCTFGRDRAPRLHRFPGGPPSRALGRRLGRLEGPYTLSVLDTSVTPDGDLWLRAALRGDETSGWRARHRADDAHVEGWLLLAEAATVLGEAGDVAASGPSPRAEVA